VTEATHREPKRAAERPLAPADTWELPTPARDASGTSSAVCTSRKTLYTQRCAWYRAQQRLRIVPLCLPARAAEKKQPAAGGSRSSAHANHIISIRTAYGDVPRSSDLNAPALSQRAF